MDADFSPKQPEITAGDRYETAINRFYDDGEIERLFDQSIKPVIDTAKENNEKSVVVEIASCLGDVLTLSPEQQAYVDAIEELLIIKGFEIEEGEIYKSPDGTTEGNHTYLRLIVKVD